MKTDKTVFWGLATVACAWLWVAGPPDAAAKSFGDMFAAAGTDLFQMSGFFSWLCWGFGIVLGVMGLASFVKAARHPQQGGVGAGIVMVAVGAFVVVLPAVLDAVQDTFGATTTTLTAPTLK